MWKKKTVALGLVALLGACRRDGRLAHDIRDPSAHPLQETAVTRILEGPPALATPSSASTAAVSTSVAAVATATAADASPRLTAFEYDGTPYSAIAPVVTTAGTRIFMIAGGYDLSDLPSPAISYFDASSGTTRRLPAELPVALIGAGATAVPGGVLVWGGVNGTGQPNFAAYLFDPVTGEIARTIPLASRHVHAAGIVSGDGLYLVGGASRTVERIDLRTYEVTAAGTLAGDHVFTSAALSGGHVVVTSATGAPEVLDLASGTARRIDRIDPEVREETLVALPDGRIELWYGKRNGVPLLRRVPIDVAGGRALPEQPLTGEAAQPRLRGRSVPFGPGALILDGTDAAGGPVGTAIALDATGEPHETISLERAVGRFDAVLPHPSGSAFTFGGVDASGRAARVVQEAWTPRLAPERSF